MSVLPRRQRLMLIGALLASVLAVIALLLDPVATYGVNAALKRMDTVVGHVRYVHIGLLAGNLSVSDVTIDQFVDGRALHIFDMREGSVHVHRLDLLRGIVRLDARLESPNVTVWRPILEQTDLPRKNPMAELRRGIPWKLDGVTIAQGTVRYRDDSAEPPVNVRLSDISVVATNLTNKQDLRNNMFAHLRVRALPLEEGYLSVDLSVDPLNEIPTFDMVVELRDLRLTRLNDVLRAYSQFEASAGEASVFAEYQAREGRFDGYVKPVLKHLEVHAWDAAQDKSTLDKLWRNAVGTTVEALRDRAHDQVAMRVPMHGTFDNPHIGVWTAAVTLLRDGFVEALVPQLDRAVGNLADD